MAARKKSAKIKWSSTDSRRAKRGWLSRLMIWSVVAGIWGSLALAVLVGWYAYDLPEVTAIAQSGRQPSISILSADGSQVAMIGDVHGKTVTLDEVAPALRQALIAVEDRRFNEHMGVDLRG